MKFDLLLVVFMYRVAIVGHSQVPRSFRVHSNPDIEIKIFRRPGGRISHIDEPPLSDAFEYNPDLVFLFLGGNDIPQYKHNCKLPADHLKATMLRF